jgi:gentisate 1,2-dioxygenase
MASLIAYRKTSDYLFEREALVTQDRQAYYETLKPHGLAPLWESLHTLVPPQPTPFVQPAHFDYDGVVRSKLMEAGSLITAEEAIRRVLILENPGLPRQAAITQSLYAGLQLILPGEVAPAHRHTQSALRFVIEGSGAYTAVDGERTIMQPGDFVITPSWTWHDHGNDSADPMVWLDGLDIPLVRFLDAGFAENSNAPSQEQSRPVGDSVARYSQNLLPVDWQPGSKNSPIFNYPYARSREALATLANNETPDSCHGHKMRYVNPATGGSAIPTIGAFLQMLPAGFATTPYRSTDSTVFVVTEGEGESRVGETRIKWKPRDVLVVPSWSAVTHYASTEAILFSFSDRPVQQALGLWREDRGN